ncbi:hypothetical protein BC936DRAFT_145794 [Jimgerdemannia flammicorona]|uniref:Uncharacterized protein n=1 Tax=Jimgerdemannia flammicorona TaxID=994334 RepID=A0A433D977_9FUNG|nr:hypothetical protein BC936DRAFT_145794 [Jimgerdemannia flammicorona]
MVDKFANSSYIFYSRRPVQLTYNFFPSANMTLDMSPRMKRKLDTEDDCERKPINKRFNSQNLPKFQLPSFVQEPLTPPLSMIEQPMYIPHQQVFPVPASQPAALPTPPAVYVPAITLASPDYKPPPAITFASPDYRPPPAYVLEQQQAYQQRLLAQQMQQLTPPASMMVDTEMSGCGGYNSASDSDGTMTPPNPNGAFFGTGYKDNLVRNWNGM